MKFTLTISIFLLSAISTFAQFNPEAQEYLDNLANAVQKAPGLKIAFEAKLSDLSGENTESGKGMLFLSKNLSRLDIDGSEIYSNDETQWVYLPEEQEVTIQPIEENELTPASIFTIYKNGYRFRLLKEEKDNVIVELSPFHIESDYVRITLNINTANEQLNSFVAQGRDGKLTNVTITQWEEKTIPENEIKYIESAHPDVEVIDLR